MADGGLRILFRAKLPHIDWFSIETGYAGTGAPDVNGCLHGSEFWIEYKQAEHWRITVRPMQIAWAERRIDHGGRVFTAIRRARTELWLYSGTDLRRLKDERLDTVTPLGRWLGGPARWDWDQVTKILTK